MEELVKKVSEDINKEEIWFLEHNKVFTAGSSTPKEFNKNKINNIEVLKVNRGGKITYHGPGQMIIYPIINIKFRKLNLIEYIGNKIHSIITLILYLLIGLAGLYQITRRDFYLSFLDKSSCFNFVIVSCISLLIFATSTSQFTGSLSNVNIFSDNCHF